MILLHMASLLVVVGFLPLLTCGQLSASDSPKSYLTNNSFTRYPPWMVSDRALLQFSFKTSELNGLLMYMESTGFFGDYLKLNLVDGALAIEVLDSANFSPIVTTIGERLNDNQVHNVEVDHEADAQFHVRLDGSNPVTVPYVPLSLVLDIENIAFSGLYFGGFPDISTVGVSTASTDVHLVGCLMDIRYSNNSTDVNDLVPQLPLEEAEVTNSCIDPCEAVDCGSGVCIQRFPLGFCDCRGTALLGPDCTEDPTLHQRTFTEEGQYLCYDNTRRQPYTGEQTTLSVTLSPPLPQTGTIMTGVLERLEYVLAIQNGSFTYKLIRDQQAIADVGISVSSFSLEVKIEASINRTAVSLTVTDLATGGVSISQEQIVPTLTFNPDFENICLGGIELEGVKYVGTIISAYTDYFSLTEERNFASLAASNTERSDVINFDVHQNQGIFEFQRSHTSATKIAFDMRTTPFEHFHILQLRNNGGATVSLTIFDSIVASTPNFDTSEQHVCAYNVEEGFWHHFELFISRDPPEITYTIDCTQSCVLATEFIGGIEQFLDNPLRFGIDLESVGNTQTRFPACYQNLVFEYASGAVFRPNLEALGRVGTTFSNTGCFNCTENQAARCPPNTCQYRDYSIREEGECTVTGLSTPLNLCPPTDTTTTDPSNDTTTTTDPSNDTTTTTDPSNDTTTTNPTTEPSPIPSPLSTGVLAGIIVGSIAAAALLVLFVILLVFLCWKVFRNCTARGFYKTYETNEKNTSALRYSASLRELSSEVVLVESNGQIPAAGAMQSNGGHSKEFYL